MLLSRLAPDGKPKYAYASSFGRSHLDENEVNQSKKYIDRFDMIFRTRTERR